MFVSRIYSYRVNRIMQTVRSFTSATTILYSENLESKMSGDHQNNVNSYPLLPDSTYEGYDATKYRKWVTLSPEKSDLSIMSFNLLSRHYTWHLRSVPTKYLDWSSYRFPLINQTISQLQSDIMCFQEMEYLIYKQFWSHNFPNENYESHYARKSLPECWGNTPDCIDGVSVFVNKEKFEVLDKKEINFAQHILDHEEDFEFTKDLEKRMLPRNTVALIVKLHDKTANKIVYVANTHLYWSPEYNDVKTLQMKLLLNELNAFVKEEDAYVLLAGDLNSTLHSSVIRILSSSGVNVSDCLAFSGFNYGFDNCFIDDNMTIVNPFNFQNVYAPLLDSQELKFTSHTTGYSGVLDHIFASRSNFLVTKLLGGVDEKYASQGGFPNAQFPSDHIPIAAEIKYV